MQIFHVSLYGRVQIKSQLGIVHVVSPGPRVARAAAKLRTCAPLLQQALSSVYLK